MIGLIDGDLVEECGHTWLSNNGYVTRTLSPSGQIHVHRWVVEKVLGRKLLSTEHVHHINNDKLDNRRCNFIVCSNSYHQLIHARQDVINDGYNPDTHHYCTHCKTYLEKHLFPKNKYAWNGVHNMCKQCSNNKRRGKGYGVFEWKERMQQQLRRAKKKGLVSSLDKEGRRL